MPPAAGGGKGKSGCWAWTGRAPSAAAVGSRPAAQPVERTPGADQRQAGGGSEGGSRSTGPSSGMVVAPLAQEVALGVLPTAHVGKPRHGAAEALPRVSQCTGARSPGSWLGEPAVGDLYCGDGAWCLGAPRPRKGRGGPPVPALQAAVGTGFWRLLRSVRDSPGVQGGLQPGHAGSATLPPARGPSGRALAPVAGDGVWRGARDAAGAAGRRGVGWLGAGLPRRSAAGSTGARARGPSSVGSGLGEAPL